MTTQLKYISLIVSLFLFFGIHHQTYAQKVKIEFENVKEKCKKLPYEERVRVTVARFNVTTSNAKRKFGDELATMLSNALQQVNCFSVLANIKNKNDMLEEIEFGEQGYTNDASSPEAGKMLGAQIVLTGEVTEFYEGEGKSGFAGITISNNKARIGFVIQAINPQTRVVIWSKSIETVGKKPGKFGGLKILGMNFAGGNKHNTAIGDAVERGIIKAVVALADEKDDIPFPKPDNSFAENKVWDTSNCPLLQSGNIPSIMFLIPEKHIHRYLPKPNGESEMISQFANAGFTVIDPAVYATVRKGARFEEALKNPIAAASLASEFGADILVIGEGTSQRVRGGNNNRVVCRATVDARVINVNNSQILMAKSADAGSSDLAENTAANAALRKASAQIADYFLAQFCTRNINGLGEAFTSKGDPSGVKMQTTLVKVSKTDFSKLKKLSDLLKTQDKINNVKRNSFSKSNAVLKIKHEGSSDDLLDILSANTGGLYEITGFDDSGIQLKMN